MKRLLIVDDEVDIAAILQDLLEYLGYEVVTAYDGRDGLRKVDERRPDLILSDVMMPNMTGPEMLDELLTHSGDRKIPAILMSAVDRHETAQALGVSFLQKPFTLDQLQPLIEQLL